MAASEKRKTILVLVGAVLRFPVIELDVRVAVKAYGYLFSAARVSSMKFNIVNSNGDAEDRSGLGVDRVDLHGAVAAAGPQLDRRSGTTAAVWRAVCIDTDHVRRQVMHQLLQVGQQDIEASGLSGGFLSNESFACNFFNNRMRSLVCGAIHEPVDVVQMVSTRIRDSLELTL